MYLQPYDGMDGLSGRIKDDTDEFNPAHTSMLSTSNDPSLHDPYSQQSRKRKQLTHPITPSPMGSKQTSAASLHSMQSPPALVPWNSAGSFQSSRTNSPNLTMDRELAAQVLCEIHTSPGPRPGSILDSPGAGGYQALSQGTGGGPSSVS